MLWLPAFHVGCVCCEHPGQRLRADMTRTGLDSAEFKAKVASEAIREELTRAEVAKKYDIPPTIITGWKRTAIENMASAFGGVSPSTPPISAGEVEKLHAKIGQLVVERDFLSAASSLILGTGGKKR